MQTSYLHTPKASDSVEYGYGRHPFIQIYSSHQRSNLLLELSDGTVRTTRNTKDKRSKGVLYIQGTSKIPFPGSVYKM